MDGFISIHALVKRATYGAGKVSVGLGDFNPRPREEGDIVNGIRDILDEDFNPRPREEGDVTHAQLALGVVISIHALVKRATQKLLYHD